MIDHQNIIDQILSIPLRNGKRIVAIVGGPASGKSTLSTTLSKQLSDACVVPMDGFHCSNSDLELHGLLARKGGAETFDVDGFIQTVRAVGQGGGVPYPTFDRNNDCVIVDGGTVKSSDTTILVEGNYLLLNVAPWNSLAKLWDFSIFLDVPIDALQVRLVQRWLDHGHDHKAALKRATENDLSNARLVLEKSLKADIVIPHI